MLLFVELVELLVDECGVCQDQFLPIEWKGSDQFSL